METRSYKIPTNPPNECTMIVQELIEILRCMQEDIQALKDENNKLKGLKGKPKIKPSTLENNQGRVESY